MAASSSTGTRRGDRFWDTRSGQWRVYTGQGRQHVKLHSAAGEKLGGKTAEGFSAGRALRRAGYSARAEGAASGRAARTGAGTLARASGIDFGGFGGFLLYAFASLIALALLRVALEGRGPAAVDKLFGLGGSAIGKLLSPSDPIFAQGPAAAPGAAASVPSQSSGAAAAESPQHAVTGFGVAGGFLPRGARYVRGRQDQGRDFQTTPGGPIVAPGQGIVVGIGSDPGGFGPDYPIVRFTSGPYAGRTLYIGHTHSALKRGQRFAAGDVLSRTGTKPVGNASVPGWAEIGFAPGGVPGHSGQPAPF